MSLKSSLARLLYPLNSIRRVLRGSLRGTRFVVVSGMGATYAMGQDHWNFHVFQRNIKLGMTVYDVGANCGQMALFFAKQVGKTGKVLSFEPVPENFEILQQNLHLNGLSHVQTFQTAIGADSMPKQFCFDSAHHTMGTFTDAMVKLNTWEKTIEVSCETLDNLIAQGHSVPDLLKIDVEGAGGGVIQGAEHLIETRRPAIYFELHAADDQAGELNALRMLQDRWGYQITDIQGNLQKELGPAWGAAVWCKPPGNLDR